MSPDDPGTLERVMALKKLPIFANLQIADLTDLARRATPRQLPAGSALPLDEDGGSVHFLLEGALSRRRGDTSESPREAPLVLGVVDVLAERRPAEHRAEVDSRSLEIGRAAFVELLQDEFEVWQATLRHVCSGALAKGLPRAGDRAAARRSPPATLAERIAWLRGVAPFAGLGIHPLGQIASEMGEVSVEPGHVFWEPDHGAGHALAIVAGEVRCSDGERRSEVGAGSLLGLAEALCGARRGYRVEARGAVRALRLDVDALIDVLEDDSEAGVEWIRLIARGSDDEADGRCGS